MILASVTEWFTDALEGVAEGILNALATLISYLLASVLDLLTFFLDFLPTFELPFTYADVYNAMAPARALNAFVPVAETASMAAIFVTFLLIYTIVKLIIKMIPGIG